MSEQIYSSSATQSTTGISSLNLTHLAYGLWALGLLTGGFLSVATLGAVVLMYLKRADVAGTVYAVHFDWLLSTFWWALLWLVISLLATTIYVGWLGVVAAVVWMLHRLIRGWLLLVEGKAP